ncbi:hypothetical protein C5167_035929 [Papaver somniferum]|nr:hypothetical protein C5167_035929 [Papaver somniferum]
MQLQVLEILILLIGVGGCCGCVVNVVEDDVVLEVRLEVVVEMLVVINIGDGTYVSNLIADKGDP